MGFSSSILLCFFFLNLVFYISLYPYSWFFSFPSYRDPDVGEGTKTIKALKYLMIKKKVASLNFKFAIYFFENKTNKICLLKKFIMPR